MEIKFKSIDDLISNTPNAFKNRKADDKDLEKMLQWVAILSKFKQTRGIDKAEFDLLITELSINVPAEISLLYANIGKSIKELSTESLKYQKFQLLSIENFRIEKDVVVKDYYTGENWFKTDVLIYATAGNIKKPLFGVDIKNGWSLSFDNDWYNQKDDMPLFQKLTTLFANIIIVNQKNFIKTKVKGITGIKRDDKAEKKFEGILTRLSDFEFYEHTIFYNHALDLIGLFRAGNVPDFLLGSNSKNNLDSFISKFEFSSAKFLKNAGI